MKKLFLSILGILSIMLSGVGCAPQTNLSVTTTAGNCPNGQTNAPYCLAVTLQNNSSGQNWISSTNYPLTNVTVSISGVSNVLSPASNSSMDPNGCTSNSTIPGSSCTFYLQLNQEQYAVGSVIPFTVTINYTINNGLGAVFGTGGGSQYSYSFTLHEYANLYSIQQNGTNNLTVYNNQGLNYYTVESASGTNIYSASVDNSSYGYVWLGTSQGMYWFGNGNTSGNTSYNPSGSTNINNIFTNQPSPFESSSSTPATMFGVANANLYNFTFAKLSWGNSITTTSSSLLNNVNAVSPSGSFVVLATSGQVYTCSTSSSGASCNNEANSNNGITSLGFATSTLSGYTGLYLATNTGLYAESGTFPNQNNSWVSVTGANINNASISKITTDDSGNVYIGGSNGNIWLVSATTNPVVASLFATIGTGSIGSIVFDNIGNTLYATSGTALYQCRLSSPSCSLIGNVGNANASAGLVIGSSISN